MQEPLSVPMGSALPRTTALRKNSTNRECHSRRPCRDRCQYNHRPCHYGVDHHTSRRETRQPHTSSPQRRDRRKYRNGCPMRHRRLYKSRQPLHDGWTSGNSRAHHHRRSCEYRCPIRYSQPCRFGLQPIGYAGYACPRLCPSIGIDTEIARVEPDHQTIAKRDRNTKTKVGRIKLLQGVPNNKEIWR